MTIDQPTHMATALLSPLLTAALVLGIVSEHSFAAEGSDSDRGFANSPAVTLGLEKSGIDPSEIATYSQFAESLLADATARVTAYGDGNVPAYAEYLKDAFIEGGFDPKDIHILPLDETVSLVVRYRGDGSSNRKPVVFSSHMDVVPAEADEWVRNPFELQQDETFYFGRGVLDNKFDVSMLTTMFVWLKAQGFVPNRDLIIAFTGDEESLQNTVQDLTNNHRHLIDAEYAIVVDGGGGALNDSGEAIQYMVGFAEKTYATYTMTAKNIGGHSSMPRADNAIFDLAAAIQRIENHRFAIETNEITRTYFERSAPFLDNEVGEAMRRFAANPKDEEAIEVLRAQPEYIGTLGTTCIPTMLSGGHAENALPRTATATINCRIFPGNSVEDIMGELSLVAGNPELEWSVYGMPVFSDTSPFNDEVMGAVEASLTQLYPRTPVIPRMISGTTDGAYFRAAGIPSYSLTGIFLNPKDSFAHGLNERVRRASIPESLVFWQSMIRSIASDAN
ncbi:MAG: M20/M25/M40 family metallo-hydrolase [Pseudomonadota bacterium]|nr:M20/M25/M40 family metallo-hydrolase [Pseudomonadota bacterium]